MVDQRFGRPRSFFNPYSATADQENCAVMKRKSDRKSRNLQIDLESLCGRPGPDDGIDPRAFLKPHQERRRCRKDLQLCRQVLETLNYVLSGECHDEILQGLIVCSVVPAPDAHRLLVTVCPLGHDTSESATEILQRLLMAQGRLRFEVANSICRRKTPELVFSVVLENAGLSQAKEERHE